MVAAALAWDADQAPRARCERPQSEACAWDRPKPVLTVPCWRCEDGAPDAECGVCRGAGVYAHRKCLCQLPAECADLVSSVGMLERGIMPFRGHWNETPEEVTLPLRMLIARRGLYHQRAMDPSRHKPVVPERHKAALREAAGAKWPRMASYPVKGAT